jgi:hypothetical protein
VSGNRRPNETGDHGIASPEGIPPGGRVHQGQPRLHRRSALNVLPFGSPRLGARGHLDPGDFEPFTDPPAAAFFPVPIGIPNNNGEPIPRLVIATPMVYAESGCRIGRSNRQLTDLGEFDDLT